VRTIADLARIERKLAVGLMSGTSMDGIDAVLVKIAGNGLRTAVETVGFLVHPYPLAVKERLLDVASWSVADVSEMNFVLGELFAGAALRVIQDAGLSPNDVHLVGSHGQTVSHLPRSTGRDGSTLQLGEPCVVPQPPPHFLNLFNVLQNLVSSKVFDSTKYILVGYSETL